MRKWYPGMPSAEELRVFCDRMADKGAHIRPLKPKPQSSKSGKHRPYQFPKGE